MSPKRKQIKRNELIEFILSPHDSTYHLKIIQKEVQEVVEVIDDIEYEHLNCLNYLKTVMKKLKKVIQKIKI